MSMENNFAPKEWTDLKQRIAELEKTIYSLQAQNFQLAGVPTNLKRENEELRAQSERLRLFCLVITKQQQPWCMEDLIEAVESTPAQSLAEIQAQAIEDASYKCRVTAKDAEGEDWPVCDCEDLERYANRLREQA